MPEIRLIGLARTATLPLCPDRLYRTTSLVKAEKTKARRGCLVRLKMNGLILKEVRK